MKELNNTLNSDKDNNKKQEKKVYKNLYLYGYVFILSLGGFNIGKNDCNFRI